MTTSYGLIVREVGVKEIGDTRFLILPSRRDIQRKVWRLMLIEDFKQYNMTAFKALCPKQLRALGGALSNQQLHLLCSMFLKV